jgi:hypothetical protein
LVDRRHVKRSGGCPWGEKADRMSTENLRSPDPEVMLLYNNVAQKRQHNGIKHFAVFVPVLPVWEVWHHVSYRRPSSGRD